MTKEIFTLFFLFTGSFFILVAALGIVRFPDLYTRMHAASKSISLGIGGMLIGVIAYFETYSIILKALAVIFFIFLTMPIASHVISRVGYRRRVKIWEKTQVDDITEEPNNTQLKYPG